jgi:elongation factor G
MGELHLDVYVERMRREYKVDVITGAPRVAYRETVSQRTEYTYVHKKQTGGSGQYGKIGGYIEPFDGEFEFLDEVVGGSVPREYIGSVEKGFKQMMAKGRLIGAPVTGVRVCLNDGAAHAVDSSDMAFQETARGAWRENYMACKPRILEPIMKVAVEGPAEFSGAMLGSINQRRGIIIGSQEDGGQARIEAEVPLSEMFGYATTIRSSTQGKAEFTMEFAKYAVVPNAISEALISKYQEEQKAAAAAKK